MFVDANASNLPASRLVSELGTTRRHIRRLVAERRIPYLKIGALVRFDPADITAWLAISRRMVARSRPCRTGSATSQPSRPSTRIATSGLTAMIKHARQSMPRSEQRISASQ